MIINLSINCAAGVRTRPFLLGALLLTLLANTACSSEAKQIELPEYSTGYDPKRDPFADGRAAIELATATNRRILIEVGGDWCRWCRALAQFKDNDSAIKQQLDKNFVVLKVNFSDENPNEAFLSTFPENQGYPHIYVSDKDGTVLHSQDTAEFLVQGNYSRQRFGDFLDKWKI